MKDTLGYFFDYADAEFDGGSYNGPSLMATLKRLSPEAAADAATIEGYSAWSVALHVAWFKYFIGRSLLGESALEAYPFDYGEDGFGKPREIGEGAWTEVLVYLAKIHGVTAAALRALEATRYKEPMPEWKIPWGSAIAWYLGHDAYHAAQIRNMGVKALAGSSG
jgi:hypothetical protein